MDSINTELNTLVTDVYGVIVKGEILIAVEITMEGWKVVLGMV